MKLDEDVTVAKTHFWDRATVKKLHGGHLTVGSNVAHVALVTVLAAVVAVAVVEVVKVTDVAFRSGSKCWKTLRRNKKVNFQTRSKTASRARMSIPHWRKFFFQTKKLVSLRFDRFWFNVRQRCIQREGTRAKPGLVGARTIQQKLQNWTESFFSKLRWR